jgi:hypothetical protein
MTLTVEAKTLLTTVAMSSAIFTAAGFAFGERHGLRHSRNNMCSGNANTPTD